MSRWLADPDLGAFAVRVLERIAHDPRRTHARGSCAEGHFRISTRGTSAGGHHECDRSDRPGEGSLDVEPDASNTIYVSAQLSARRAIS